MKRVLVLFGLLATLVLFACERRGRNETNDTGAILVRYYGDLSGRTSNFGQSTKNGVEMAVDEINKQGGFNGREIRILSEDDEGRPEKAATVVTKSLKSIFKGVLT